MCTIAAIIWAWTGPGIKWLLDAQASGLAIALWRDVLLTVFLGGVLVLFRRDLLRISARDFWPLAGLGVISIGIYHALWIWSVDLNGASVAVILIYLFPTFATIGARFVFGEQLRPVHIVGLFLSLFGLILLVEIYDTSNVNINWLGIGVGLTTAVLQAGYALYSQHAVRTVNPWTALLVTMGSGSITLAIMFALAPLVVGAANAPHLFQIGDTTAWLILALIAIGPTLGGYALFNLALRHIPASIGSLILVLEAPTASIIAMVFLKEFLNSWQLVGMVLILIAIVLPTLWRERQPAVVVS
jgi:drug/metabolite transporter (DMT)-like permease